MALVKISKGADIQHKYTDGVSRVSVLEGAYKDAAVERVSLRPGADFTPETYTREQHNQVFLVTAGSARNTCVSANSASSTPTAAAL